MDLRAAQQMTDSGHEQVNGTAPAGAAAAATDSAPADCGSFAGSLPGLALEDRVSSRRLFLHFSR